jgi:hypothetical protein
MDINKIQLALQSLKDERAHIEDSSKCSSKEERTR